MPKKVGTGRRYRVQAQRFAEALALGLSPEKAGKEAGYKGAANCRRNAQRPDVKAMVAELKKEAKAKLIAAIAVNDEYVERHLVEVIEASKHKTEDAEVGEGLRAAELLMKKNGWLAPEKREIDGVISVGTIEHVIIEPKASEAETDDRDGEGLSPTAGAGAI